jgi:hypothetical protein
MYPNLGSGTTQPSAPPNLYSKSTSASLPNAAASSGQFGGFSSITPQSFTQNTPYPSNTQPPNTSGYSPYSLPNTSQPPPQGQHQ